MTTDHRASEVTTHDWLYQPVKFWGSLGLSLVMSTTLTWATLYSSSPASAQANLDATLSDQQATPEVPPVPSGLNVIYVDATNGSDTNGNGSQQAPYRTLTYVTEIAPSGTIIQLLPGLYSEASGEVFPLKLKAGQILRGEEATLGEGILISGGGTYISPTLARQNVTMLADSGSEIRGVSMRNEGRRGYALWLESTAPKVYNNSFVGSIHDGIFLTGEANAWIEGNRFYQNGANGISVLGTSAPTIVNNLFQETGFGITVDKQSSPLIQDNRILQNRTGVIVGGDARPRLRGNQISQNLQTGLTAITRGIPDLGTANDPGNNVFQGNGDLDINNSTRGGVIVAFGNQLSGGTQGQVDVSGQAIIPAVATSAPNAVADGSLTLPATPAAPPTPAPDLAQASEPAPTLDLTPSAPVQPIAPTNAPAPTLDLAPSAPVQPTEPIAQSAETVPSPAETPADTVAVTGVPPLTTPDPQPATPSTTDSTSTAPNVPVSENDAEFRTVPFTPDAAPAQPIAQATPPVVKTPAPDLVPQPVANPLVSSEAQPVLDITTLLPPPGVRQLQAQSPEPTPTPSAGAPVDSTTGDGPIANTSGAQFRILVTPTPNNDLQKLQSLIPGAVATVFNGRDVLEAGLYDSRSTAQAVLDQLLDAGFEAIAEMIFP